MLHISDITAPSACIFEAVAPLLEIIESLLELVLGCEHEGTIVGDGLVYGLACKHDELRVLFHRLDIDILDAVLTRLERDRMRG